MRKLGSGITKFGDALASRLVRMTELGLSWKMRPAGSTVVLLLSP
jgi:hypothetical protein